MRILQVVPRYAPAWAFGGGVRITYELAKVWVSHGHEVTVFTSDQQDTQRRFADSFVELDGIKIHRFRNRAHSLAARLPFLFFRPTAMRTSLMAAEKQWDVIHVAEARGAHNRFVGEFSAKYRVPVVWSPYGGLADGEGVRRIYRKVHDWVYNTRQMVSRSAGIVAQTSHEREVALRFGARPDRVQLIPLAVNLNDIGRLPPRGAFRKKLGLSATDQMILFVGRLHYTKGLQVLIPAFADVLRRVPEARLVLVGWDQGYKQRVVKLSKELGVAEKLVFAGAVYDRERFQAYVDADVFSLTPGVYEETSLAALEACACGAPCVITEQCEIPGLDETGAGLTVKYERGAVAAALIDSLASKRRTERGLRARRLIEERFAVEAVATRHEQFFAEVVRRGG